MGLVVEQREIQKRGGPCARYPTSCVVRDLLGRAGLLRPFQPLYVVDLTYGQGIFYYAIRSKVVVAAVDVSRLDWVVRPRYFKRVPAQAWRRWLPEALRALGGRVDVVAVDPPWECAKGGGCRGREPGARYHYRASRAYGIPEDILRAGLEVAGELGAPLLYHWREPLGLPHLAGPVGFKPFFHVINPRAEGYVSWFGVARVDAV